MRTCSACGYEKPQDQFIKGQCKPCRYAKVKAWHLAHPERRAQHRRKWLRENTAVMGQMRRDWMNANPARVAETTRRYQASKRRAVPRWANVEQMALFYAEARARTAVTGVPHEVDHIVPLTSPVVCGLHCEHNLQVLPMSANRSKANRFVPQMVVTV